MFRKILIANRGEIAVRIMATASALGIATVAVHSTQDRDALHVRRADEAVDLGDGPASENYLSIPAVLRAAQATGAEAIHPGYGFLAENADFARAVAEAGLVFIGPPASAIDAMGGKVTAREVAVAADVPLAPGSDGAIAGVEEVLAFGEDHGYPVLIKASAGGGGRGMRRVNGPDEARDALEAAVREAEKAFGNGEVYLERYLTSARHVEVQVFVDDHGHAVYYGDRDCSVQRRHQKLIEEAPAPGLSDRLRHDMGEAAARLAREVGYRGAGTVEFMVEGESFYFLEMNTRIQVEHPVTELVQGLDLVAEQLRVAAGEPLSVTESGRPADGHAIEVRLNAEDVAGGLFVPAPGPISSLVPPTGEGIRFDAGYESGDEVLPFYDSLIGKLIAWGPDRDTALGRLRGALDELVIEGVPTTAPAAAVILDHPDFRAVEISTLWLENQVDLAGTDADEEEPFTRQEVEVAGRYYRIPVFAEPPLGAAAGAPATAAVPAAATADGGEERSAAPRRARRGRRGGPASDGSITSPMQGTVVKVNVSEGQQVTAGELLFVVEAMKMENPVVAPMDGTAGPVLAEVGQSLPAGTLLTTLVAEEAAA